MKIEEKIDKHLSESTYMRLYIVPAYTKEEMRTLENFFMSRGIKYSIPKNPPKNIFDKG